MSSCGGGGGGQAHLPVYKNGSGVPIERICRVGVGEQLWQEGFKDVGKIVQGRPRLSLTRFLRTSKLATSAISKYTVPQSHDAVPIWQMVVPYVS